VVRSHRRARCLRRLHEGHSIDRRETKIELLTRTARFLEDTLK